MAISDREDSRFQEPEVKLFAVRFVAKIFTVTCFTCRCGKGERGRIRIKLSPCWAIRGIGIVFLVYSLDMKCKVGTAKKVWVEILTLFLVLTRSPVTQVEFSDENILVSTSNDCTRFWDVNTGIRQEEIQGKKITFSKGSVGQRKIGKFIITVKGELLLFHTTDGDADKDLKCKMIFWERTISLSHVLFVNWITQFGRSSHWTF